MVVSGPPVVVGVTMFVLSISSLSEVKMVYIIRKILYFTMTCLTKIGQIVFGLEFSVLLNKKCWNTDLIVSIKIRSQQIFRRVSEKIIF